MEHTLAFSSSPREKQFDLNETREIRVPMSITQKGPSIKFVNRNNSRNLSEKAVLPLVKTPPNSNRPPVILSRDSCGDTDWVKEHESVHLKRSITKTGSVTESRPPINGDAPCRDYLCANCWLAHI